MCNPYPRRLTNEWQNVFVLAGRPRNIRVALKVLAKGARVGRFGASNDRGTRALVERASMYRMRTNKNPQHYQYRRTVSTVSRMALRPTVYLSMLQMFAPQISSITPTFRTRTAAVLLRQLYRPLPSLLPLALPAAIALNIPSLLSGIWESILRAVPKKKTSHMKKRHRFMAGKALKDVTNLNKCSACGNVKRAHLLCPYCVRGTVLWPPSFGNCLPNFPEIRDMWLGRTKDNESTKQVEA